MESRRQAALQRKAEEEKTRHQEQERKVKEEIERRKREREEQVEKKPIKPMAASTSNKKVRVPHITEGVCFKHRD